MADDKSDRYGLMTFTGPANTRTYYDRDGVLQTAAQDEPREAYDPLTGAYLGLLIEQEATNYVDKNLVNSLSSSNAKVESNGDINGVSFFKISKTDADKRAFVSASGIGESGIKIAVSFLCVKNTSRIFTIGPRTDNVSVGYPCTINTQEETISLDSRATSGSVKNLGRGLLFVSLEYTSAASGFSGISITDFQDGFLIGNLQIEIGTHASSYVPTNGSPVTRERDDARFTDPAVFNNFERGAFVIDFRTVGRLRVGGTSIVLGRGPNFRFLNDRLPNEKMAWNGKNGPLPIRKATDGKWCVSWIATGEKIETASNGEVFDSQAGTGSWGAGDLVIAPGSSTDGWFGYIKSLDFQPEPLTDSEAQQLTTVNARTVIGDCPSGGYYDYSDLSTLFVESDASGIPIADRTPARVGSRVGYIMDTSGHESHITAVGEDRRGILESDGIRYWIRSDAMTAYDFSVSVERTVTFFHAIDAESVQRFVRLSASAGGSSAYAGAYSDDDSMPVTSGWPLSPLRLYANGEAYPADSSADAGAAVTQPAVMRELYGVDGALNTRMFLNGYTDNGFTMSGKMYGFAWASRLSEDDALIVEADMRRNMPEIPA